MKNVLIITYWSFNDALIQTYTLPYVLMIRKKLPIKYKVFLFTLEQEDRKMNEEEWERQKDLFSEKNIHLLRFGYSNFGVLMILKFGYIFTSLFTLLYTQKISHIHAWCTPAGAIGYFLSVFSGKKLILDSYEPHAEPMVESGTWLKESIKFKLLFWLEKKQVERASEVIACVTLMKIYIKDKFNVSLNKMYVKPACVDFDLFDIKKRKDKALLAKYDLNNKIIGAYAGKFGGSYLEEEVFEFLKIAENHFGEDKFRFILLTNHSKAFIDNLVAKFQLNENTIIQLFIPHNQVPDYLGLADFGITPFIPVPSKRYGTPIKNGEYWAMGLPVIITKNISDDSDIIDTENIGYVLQGLTNSEYLKACLKIEELLTEDRTKLTEKIRTIANQYRNYSIAEKVYTKIYLLNNELSCKI